MKLTATQLDAARAVLGVDPIPEDNPALADLTAAFGEHTFYVFEQGLLVFEPDDDPDTSDTTARLTITAAWADDDKTSLAPVEPQATNVVVELEPAEQAD